MCELFFLFFFSFHIFQHPKDILKSARVGNHRLDLTAQSDHVIWLGDLNYRIDLTDSKDGKASGTLDHQLHFRRVRDKIELKDWSTLYLHDQLRRARMNGKVLTGFQEMEPPCFPPTFKVERGTARTMDYQEKRIPSWCDRILWKSNTLRKRNNIKCLTFESVPSSTTSDHKPVRAYFEIQLEKAPNLLLLNQPIEKRNHDATMVQDASVGRAHQLSNLTGGGDGGGDGGGSGSGSDSVVGERSRSRRASRSSSMVNALHGLKRIASNSLNQITHATHGGDESKKATNAVMRRTFSMDDMVVVVDLTSLRCEHLPSVDTHGKVMKPSYYIVVDVLPNAFSTSDKADQCCGKTKVVHKSTSPVFDVKNMHSINTCAIDARELAQKGALVLTVFHHAPLSKDQAVGNVVIDLSECIQNFKKVNDDSDSDDADDIEQETKKTLGNGNGNETKEAKGSDEDENEDDVVAILDSSSVGLAGLENLDVNFSNKMNQLSFNNKFPMAMEFNEKLVCNGVRVTGEPASMSPSTISGTLNIHTRGGGAPYSLAHLHISDSSSTSRNSSRSSSPTLLSSPTNQTKTGTAIKTETEIDIETKKAIAAAHSHSWKEVSGNFAPKLTPPIHLVAVQTSSSSGGGMHHHHLSFRAAAKVVSTVSFIRPAREVACSNASWEEMSGNVLPRLETSFNWQNSPASPTSGANDASSTNGANDANDASGASGTNRTGNSRHIPTISQHNAVEMRHSNLKRFNSSGNATFGKDLRSEDDDNTTSLMSTNSDNSVISTAAAAERRHSIKRSTSAVKMDKKMLKRSSSLFSNLDPEEDPHLSMLSDSSSICGWLKKGDSRTIFGRKTWRVRWFELDSTTCRLTYYTKQHEERESTTQTNAQQESIEDWVMHSPTSFEDEQDMNSIKSIKSIKSTISMEDMSEEIAPHAIIDVRKYVVCDLGDLIWELIPPNDGRKKEKITKRNSKISLDRVWRFKADDVDHKNMWMASMKMCSKDGIDSWKGSASSSKLVFGTSDE